MSIYVIYTCSVGKGERQNRCAVVLAGMRRGEGGESQIRGLSLARECSAKKILCVARALDLWAEAASYPLENTAELSCIALWELCSTIKRVLRPANDPLPQTCIRLYIPLPILLYIHFLEKH
jgi:hypothetical protein